MFDRLFQQADCAKNKTDPMPFENSYNLFFSTFARLIFFYNKQIWREKNHVKIETVRTGLECVYEGRYSFICKLYQNAWQINRNIRLMLMNEFKIKY